MEGFLIHNLVNIHFDWKDRRRILFGKTAHCDTKIYVDKEVTVIKGSETHCYVDNVIEGKSEGKMEMDLISVDK